MSNYNNLKTTIDASIKQNNNQEITGSVLNSVLNQMVTTLGAGYQYVGVATTTTNPGSPDAKVFYIANGKGTYTNFGGLEVTEDEVVVLYWDSSWHKVSTGVASQEKLTELNTKVIGDTLLSKTGGTTYDYFDYDIKMGRRYKVKNESSAICNFNLYSAKNESSKLASIRTLQPNEEYEFVAPVNAPIVGGYFNSTDHSCRITTESLDDLAIEVNAQNNAIGVINDRLTNSDQRMGVNKSFESSAPGVESFSFFKGRKYTIINNGDASVNYSTRLTENGSTIDGVFTIAPGYSHTFVASADALYLRHNLGTTCEIVVEPEFAKNSDIGEVILNIKTQKLADETYFVVLPSAMTEDTKVILSASSLGFMFVDILPASSFSRLARVKFDGSRTEMIIPSGGARLQFTQNGTLSGEVTFDIRKATTIKERLFDAESKIADMQMFLSVGMFASIGAIGDSFTAASVYHNVEGSVVYYKDFPEQSYIATIAKRNGLTYKNYGIGGSTAQSWMTNPLGYAKFQADDKCSFYFLAHGLNDQAQIAAGQLSLGTIADIGTNANTFYGNYSRLVNSVISQAPSAKFCAIKMPLFDYSLGVLNVNKAIEDIANHYGIMCINPLDDEFFKSDFFNTQMGGHPTCGGYCGMGMAYERLLSKEMMSHTEYLLDANF